MGGRISIWQGRGGLNVLCHDLNDDQEGDAENDGCHIRPRCLCNNGEEWQFGAGSGIKILHAVEQGSSRGQSGDKAKGNAGE